MLHTCDLNLLGTIQYGGEAGVLHGYQKPFESYSKAATHSHDETQRRLQLLVPIELPSYCHTNVSKSEAELYDLFTSQWAMGAGCIAIGMRVGHVITAINASVMRS
ncbi:hypothetical protein M0802_007332 [Mischocyttarus mexicanus]|nr:hypothetical protein M0802_007332 [Mischocyttarus mexicanus]